MSSTCAVDLPGFRLRQVGIVGTLTLFGKVEVMWVGRRMAVGLV